MDMTWIMLSVMEQIRISETAAQLPAEKTAAKLRKRSHLKK